MHHLTIPYLNNFPFVSVERAIIEKSVTNPGGYDLSVSLQLATTNKYSFIVTRRQKGETVQNVTLILANEVGTSNLFDYYYKILNEDPAIMSAATYDRRAAYGRASWRLVKPSALEKLITLQSNNNGLLYLNSKTINLESLEHKTIPGPDVGLSSRHTVYTSDYRIMISIDDPEKAREFENGNIYISAFAHKHYSGKPQTSRIGIITKELILQNNEVPLNRSVYILREPVLDKPVRVRQTRVNINRSGRVSDYGMLDGSRWPGPVHEHENELMTGPIHYVPDPGESSPQAFVTEEIQPNDKIIDYRILDLAAEININAPSTTSAPRRRRQNYFSDLNISRNNKGTANGIFSFDLAAYAKNNIALKGMLENKTSALSSISIKYIEIFSCITSQENKSNRFTTSRQKCVLDPLSIIDRIASLKKNCYILNTPNNGEEILDISFLDDTVKMYSSNFVEYSVIMTLEDHSIKYVKQIISELTNRVRLVERTLNARTIRRMRSSTSDAYTFFEEYTERQIKIYQELVEKYIQTLIFIKGPSVFEPYDSEYWYQNLSIIHYDHRVLSVIKDFIFNIKNIISPANSSTSGAPDYNSKINMAKKNRYLIASSIFDNRLKISGPPNYGVSVIDQIVDHTGPAPTVSYNEYEKRTLEETAKYDVDNPDSTLINRYGFLSPSYIGKGKAGIIDTKTLDVDADAILPVIRGGLSRTRVFNNQKQNNDLTEKLEVMNLQGISIKPLKGSLKKIVVVPDLIDPAEQSLRDILSRDTAFATEIQSETLGSEESIFSTEVVQNPSTTPVINSVVNSVVSGYANPKNVAPSNVSSINTSPMYQKLKSESLSADKAIANAVNFDSIQAIQYLDAYDEELGIRNQNWKTLDKLAFDNAKEENRPLVCRFVKQSGIVRVNSLVELPTMGSTFIIGEIAEKTTTGLPPRLPDISVSQENDEPSQPPSNESNLSETNNVSATTRRTTRRTARRTTRRTGY